LSVGDGVATATVSRLRAHGFILGRIVAYTGNAQYRLDDAKQA
jgi:hypothetical protein